MFVIEQRPPARLSSKRRRAAGPRVLPHGRLLRRALAPRSASRARRPSRRSRTAVLLRLRREDFRRAARPSYPEFRERIEERIAAVRLPAPRAGAARLRRGDPAGRGRRARARRRRTGRAARGPHDRGRRRVRDEAEPAEPARAPKPPRRFPHVYQLDEMDCGAACLAMVCRYFGRAVALSHIREVVHTSTRRDEPGRDHRAAPRSSGSPRAPCTRRRASSTSCRCRRSSTGRATTGSCSTTSTDDHVRVADPARGLRRLAARRVPARSGPATPRCSTTPSAFEQAPEAQPSLALAQAVLAPAPPARS